jgi:hypothetical protein
MLVHLKIFNKFLIETWLINYLLYSHVAKVKFVFVFVNFQRCIYILERCNFN